MSLRNDIIHGIYFTGYGSRKYDFQEMVSRNMFFRGYVFSGGMIFRDMFFPDMIFQAMTRRICLSESIYKYFIGRHSEKSDSADNDF